jgi:hypothetical protein
MIVHDGVLGLIRLHVQMAAMLIGHAQSLDILISFGILISPVFSSVGLGQAQDWGTT